MQFWPEGRPIVSGFRKPQTTPEKRPETVEIDEELSAELSFSSDSEAGSRISFTINGQDAPWSMDTFGLPKKELIKIIRGLRAAQ